MTDFESIDSWHDSKSCHEFHITPFKISTQISNSSIVEEAKPKRVDFFSCVILLIAQDNIEILYEQINVVKIKRFILSEFNFSKLNYN